MKYVKTLDIQKNGRPCIYKIQNQINNKVYIGSAIGHYRRKGQHYYLLRNNKHFNKYLQDSWNKYGESNFIFEIIEFTQAEKLKKKEEYYIKIYNSNDRKNGFNFRINCNTNLGIKRSLESRLKQSHSKKGKTPNIDYIKIAKLNSKPVIGMNKETKKTVKFNSVKQAGETLNIQRTSISKALHHRLKSAGGYIWDFTEKSVLKNPVNSEKVQKDNSEPSLMNDIKVIKKVQRLTSEESTNNLDKSAGQPNL